MGEQKQENEKKHICAGLLAHVDAGKTTLSEAMLYTGGAIRKLGRVDKGDAFLDTYELEKKRGITIFSKQALLRYHDMEITLLDTPGHVDFSAEMERTLQVLDYAILVISGSEGVQGHTRTLWRLLARYEVPTFLFINKMDLAGEQKEEILADLKKNLGGNFVDFGTEGSEEFLENAAMSEESVLEQYLETGEIAVETIRNLITDRELFPCFFGSALRLSGVEEFMRGMENYMDVPLYPEKFGARVFKIARDPQGNRLTYVKVTGGTLRVKDMIDGEKVNQLRVYSGDKYEMISEAKAGTVCAVTGLTKAVPGHGLGIDAETVFPVLEPVLTYRILLPEEVDAAAMLPKLLQLEEEEPELHIAWEEEKKEIHAQLMGEIQMEILKSLVKERFDISIGFGERSIVYKETIQNTVEGVGHFEPLRHYAEVHLLLEPGEPGSGMTFGTACSEDILDKNWQRLVMTHLEEKEHRGVLTGAPLTDMRITLMSGRAHVKHTEGGDFRQSVYRAVRQGLMQAESVLLEPFYDFRLEIPERMIGRAMTDIERMNGSFEPPMIELEQAILKGTAPVSTMDGYQAEVTAYTGGTGHLTCVLKGYGPCHNAEEVIAASGYDPDADLENPSGSVFCTHGAGFVVNWDEVASYMHLESCLTAAGKRGASRAEEAASGARSADGLGGNSRQGTASQEIWIGTDEIDSILSRTYNANKRNKNAGRRKWSGKTVSGVRNGGGAAVSRLTDSTYRQPGTYTAGTSVQKETAAPKGISVPKGKEPPRDEYLLVDGYNIIFAWQELKELAEINIDSARDKLLDILCNYQGYKKCGLIAVFDAYRVQGHATEFLDYHNIHVVYTKEAETADQYIEKFAHENGKKYRITVATSDHLEQIIIRGQGCVLLSAREFEKEITRVEELLRQEHGVGTPLKSSRHYLFDSIPKDVLEQLRREAGEE
ncbi:MAG: translation factor GTPase family protein [Clostridium sp.]|nr:translation factor GTPase family protein [Clostridium sp.]